MHLSKNIPSCPYCGGETICFAESDCHGSQGNIAVDAYCGCLEKECGEFCEDSCKLSCDASDQEILKASAELLEKVIEKFNQR